MSYCVHTIVTDIITKLILLEHSPVTNPSNLPNQFPQNFLPGALRLSFPSAGQETVMNYQLSRLEFISVIVWQQIAWETANGGAERIE